MGAARTFKTKIMGLLTKDILKKRDWSRRFPWQKPHHIVSVVDPEGSRGWSQFPEMDTKTFKIIL